MGIEVEYETSDTFDRGTRGVVLALPTEETQAAAWPASERGGCVSRLVAEG